MMKNTGLPKITFLLFIENEPSDEVIFELFSFFKFTSYLENIFKSEGNKVNVTKNDVNKPIVIIQPKSMIGLISLKINDKKAHTVVNTV